MGYRGLVDLVNDLFFRSSNIKNNEKLPSFFELSVDDEMYLSKSNFPRNENNGDNESVVLVKMLKNSYIKIDKELFREGYEILFVSKEDTIYLYGDDEIFVDYKSDPFGMIPFDNAMLEFHSMKYQLNNGISCFVIEPTNGDGYIQIRKRRKK
jgi:hypothetical protein